MTSLNKNKLLFVFLVLFIPILWASPAFCSEKLNAGVVFEFYSDTHNQIPQENLYSEKNLPKISNEDINIAYLKDFRPLNMLSMRNTYTIAKTTPKALNYEQTPKEYHLSLNSQNIMAAAKITPKYEELFSKALNLKNKHRYKDALETIDEALKDNQTDAQGHFLKADILRLSGNFQQSILEYALAISIDPCCTDAYFNIAKILENSNKKELALEYYRYAYTTKPDDYEIRNIILGYEKQGIN